MLFADKWARSVIYHHAKTDYIKTVQGFSNPLPTFYPPSIYLMPERRHQAGEKIKVYRRDSLSQLYNHGMLFHQSMGKLGLFHLYLPVPLLLLAYPWYQRIRVRLLQGFFLLYQLSSK